MNNFQGTADFIWSVADLLRHDYKRADYGKVILPFTVLRRLDCVLESTKDKVLTKLPELKQAKVKNIDPILNQIAKQSFHNRSKYDFKKLKEDPDNIAANLRNYINGFSENAREILEYFKLDDEISTLDDADLLFLVVNRFEEIDLHPNVVSNEEMGYIFEELIRKFAEYSNETAGEHFTPREVIRLMVNLIFGEDAEILKRKGIVKTLYDPACGTGGMLSISEEYLHDLNPESRLEVFGQEINPETYAVCKSEMMLKGNNITNIKFGNSFTRDGLHNEKFDYMLSNPPYGVEWKKFEKEVRNEHEELGFSGRFGAGLPRINDGSLLFLQHMISKMKQDATGSRIGIVFNGSPLFIGDGGSGESDIRRWIIEHDWLEAIIALPNDLFYNTGIFTYIWIVTNRKNSLRKGKIQLINGISFSDKMRKSLGNKRNEITPENIAKITKIYHDFKLGEYCKIFDNEDFGYRKIIVECPLRLNFQISEERVKRLYEESGFLQLSESKKKGQLKEKEIKEGKKLQNEIVKLLETINSNKIYKNRDEFLKVIRNVLQNKNITMTSSLEKAILSALSERDETADICKDSKGNPEHDPELRDSENVPIKEDIQVYFEREVKPYLSDAWIDEEKTKIGYEIPLTRHFYIYKPLRTLEEIDSDIKKLENEMLDMLKNITK